MPPSKPLAPPAGRDAPLPAWLAGGEARPERPRFDSVVVRGNGIGALVCAARLARSDALRGRVHIAAPRPVESRRLVNGCTLRARSLDYFAAALGCDRDALLDELFGERRSAAEAHTQRAGMAFEEETGRFRLGRIGLFMGEAADGDVLAYGLRNGHLAGRLADRVAALGVRFDDDVPDTFEACRARADGDRTLVVNGSHLPVSDLPAAAAPDRFVVASQLTLRRRENGALPPDSSFVGMRRRAGALDTGVFYPFVDPLSPAADAYGIFYRVVWPGPDFRKADEISIMRRTVEGVADALGFDPVDADETRGEAMVPCLPWRDVPSSRPDWLDLHRTYSACTPIITGDGMTRAGLAGWVAAELILAGEDPVPATNLSLRRWRGTNRGFALAVTRLSRLTAAVVGHAPGRGLRFVGAAPDMWAGLDRAMG
jgi:hypothetical protein